MTLEQWYSQVAELENKIGYRFQNPMRLQEAMTHSSYANERKKIQSLRDNERLEFLGDSVLGLIVSDYIFQTYHELPEGELTKVRANVVCERALAMNARRIELGRYLLLGRGEENNGGRERDSILADALESLIAALYLDGGLEEARSFVLAQFHDLLDLAAGGEIMNDYKTNLQEMLQNEGHESIEYQVIHEEGPDHHKHFYVHVSANGEWLGEGEGKSKKEAEQDAARSALESLQQRTGNESSKHG